MSVSVEYYELDSCLDYNDIGLSIEAVDTLLAVYEGQNDGEDWRWVLALKDGRFAFVQGGCDYTGWDCQSWATVAYAPTALEAVAYARGDVPVGDIGTGNHPADAGLGHMIALIGDGYSDLDEVYTSLLRQLTDGKSETWREQTERELLGDKPS